MGEAPIEADDRDCCDGYRVAHEEAQIHREDPFFFFTTLWWFTHCHAFNFEDC